MVRPKFNPFRRFRSFRKDSKGSTIVEFAMVATPFLGLMGMIVETGIGFLAMQTLDTAASIAGRKIMVGEIGRAGNTSAQQQEAFKQELCKNAAWFIKCTDLYYDVQSYTSFGDADMGVPMKDNTLNTDVLPRYNPGGAGAIVVVRAYYKRKVYADFVSKTLGSLPGGYQLIIGTSVFKTES